MHEFIKAIVKDTTRRQERVFQALKNVGVDDAFEVITYAKEGANFIIKHFTAEELDSLYRIII